MVDTLDLVLVNPGGRDTIYQQLGEKLSAVEPPLWCRLIAGYALDRGCSVRIIDSEAECWDPDRNAQYISELSPRLVAMVVFGHQPSASTQQMAAAREICRAIKQAAPDQKIIIVGGHVAALPDRTIREEAADFACNGEGAVTVQQLVEVLRAGGDPCDLAKVEGLVYWDGDEVRSNPGAKQHLSSLSRERSEAAGC